MGNFTCRIWREVLLLLAVVYLFTSGFGSQQGSSFPPIEQMGEGIFKFGEVILDQKKRTISLPAVCNQTSGLVEYGLVHVNGKIHESLFRTNVSPRLIHASLLLLKERSFPEFFGDQNYSSSPRFFDIFVEWEWNNSSIVRPLSSMIYNESSTRFLSEGRFLFTGSKKVEGQYLAEMDGSIISIYQDARATINNADSESEFDDVWLAHLPQMPPLDTPVSICLKLPNLP